MSLCHTLLRWQLSLNLEPTNRASLALKQAPGLSLFLQD